MDKLPRVVMLIGSVLLIGCYHATIETGAAPSLQTVEKPWAAGWLYGLVPPSLVETAAKCPDGVAKVETQLSFLNMLAQALTLGIYSPMNIKVTCAQSSNAELTPPSDRVRVDEEADLEEQREDITAAAIRSADLGRPVYVIFE